jgi:bifunctional UDP-N-acetylglucosamine pyrophosphorylase / glucosamine-1-phosphate N-acetyltransferase
MNLYVIVLAAGKGTRMRSLDNDKSKVAYQMLGVPLINHVLNALKPLQTTEIITVVGFGGNKTSELISDQSSIVWQHEQKGTGHAIMQAAPLLNDKQGVTLIISGDTPLLSTSTLQELIKNHKQNKHDLTILTAELENPFGYGRIIRNEYNYVEAIVEQADASSAQSEIKEINSGVYVFDNEKLFNQLNFLQPNNQQQELYLTDLVKLFKQKGYIVGAQIVGDSREILGINDRIQLAEAENIMKHIINSKLMKQGVTIEDPNNTYIGPQVTIGADTIIKPGCYIMGNTTIGTGNIIGPDTTLENMEIGNENKILKSYLVDSVVGNNNQIGPFTHIRGHAQLQNGTRVGNFVEVKASLLKDGSKVAHLSYIGDTEVGEKTNIGCGTITANYDGKNKHKTIIGKNVFVGSGTTIIAPVTIEDNSFIAAGSTINKDVPADAMAIARARQENKEGYAIKLKDKINQLKK